MQIYTNLIGLQKLSVICKKSDISQKYTFVKNNLNIKELCHFNEKYNILLSKSMRKSVL